MVIQTSLCLFYRKTALFLPIFCGALSQQLTKKIVCGNSPHCINFLVCTAHDSKGIHWKINNESQTSFSDLSKVGDYGNTSDYDGIVVLLSKVPQLISILVSFQNNNIEPEVVCRSDSIQKSSNNISAVNERVPIELVVNDSNIHIYVCYVNGSWYINVLLVAEVHGRQNNESQYTSIIDHLKTILQQLELTSILVISDKNSTCTAHSILATGNGYSSVPMGKIIIYYD